MSLNVMPSFTPACANWTISVRCISWLSSVEYVPLAVEHVPDREGKHAIVYHSEALLDGARALPSPSELPSPCGWRP